MANIVKGVDLSTLTPGPYEAVATCSRRAAAEGCVLLENRNRTLPIRDGDRVSFFGRMQGHYLGSGSGSGGLVVVPYRTNLLDALRADRAISVNEDLAAVYADFVKDHPFDNGHGWATEPWFQEEMPLTDELVDTAAAQSDIALIVLTRLAGEARDSDETAYRLTPAEEDMIAKVTAKFDRTAVLLNTGSIMDMSWVDKYRVPAVMYLWQGGMEGGNAGADALRGRVNPSGKLPDTIANDLYDYPSTVGFGNPDIAVYTEDVYVGYRYFETAAPDAVRYPFGYGLSYTTFTTEVTDVKDAGGQIRINATVTNTGDTAGRQVVQAYFSAPQGKLGRPLRELAAFGKTKLLQPGEAQTLVLAFDLDRMAAYDDAGVTGYPYAYVMEAGDYVVYVGDDVRAAKAVYTYPLAETIVTEQLEQALAPEHTFLRMHPLCTDAGVTMGLEPTPTRQYDVKERMASLRPKEIAFTGNRGLLLADVKEGRCTMDAFLAQMTDDDLIAIARGEGMCSPKVTGSGSAFGGITESLQTLGIPAISTSDGPSGLRMQGADDVASLMPNGTLLAATFDVELNEELFTYEGMEMYAYKVDTLLGPGVNIHRSPLNGRNFEYFSEDPFLTGQMAAAQCRGLGHSDVTATVKHFCANNQEKNRNGCNSVASERALREIYLRPFEIAVKEGGKGATAIMTSYNLVNGVHTASSYDLNTTILRGEWGYDGCVMTDWWAKGNATPDEADSPYSRACMARAQNDVYMVVGNGNAANDSQDDLRASLENGTLPRADLQRNAANICRYAMRVYAMDRYAEQGYQPRRRKENGRVLCDLSGDAIKKAEFDVPEDMLCEIELTAVVDAPELDQIPVSIGICYKGTTRLQMHGTNGEAIPFTTEAWISAGKATVPVYNPQKVTVKRIVVREI